MLPPHGAWAIEANVETNLQEIALGWEALTTKSNCLAVMLPPGVLSRDVECCYVDCLWEVYLMRIF